MKKRHFLSALAATTAALVQTSKTEALTYADYMLHLINIERRKAGVDPVALGSNAAAQIHADNMVRFCYSAHWGIDGTKPYMRHSLAGGYQNSGENVGGIHSCFLEQVRSIAPIGSVVPRIHIAMRNIMASPGHKRTMLDSQYKKVSIGIAWDRYNFKMCQLFEGDYVTFSKLPSIDSDGVLTMSGSTKNGIELAADEVDFSVNVAYDPPLKTLTIGHMSRVHSYFNGGIPKVVFIHSHANITSDTIGMTIYECPDPYDLPEDVQPAETIGEYRALKNESKIACPSLRMQVPLKNADRWTILGNSFSIEADISEILSENGDGIYTVSLYHEDAKIEFAQYSIFYGVEPPTGYVARLPHAVS